MDGLAIYDKLSETYGIQDIIKDKLKSHLRKHRSIVCHNNMILQMKKCIGDFLDFQKFIYNDVIDFQIVEDSYLWKRYMILMLPEFI